MRVRVHGVGIFVALSLVTGACAEHTPTQAAPSPPTGERADAIQGGTADLSSSFALSVLSDQDVMCSGTLIAPNLVLTARHCVATDSGGAAVNCATDRFAAPSAPSTLRVSLLANAPPFADAELKVTKVLVPTDTLFCGNDLALLILDKLVPAAVARPATPAIDPPLTDRAKYGAKLTAIGYGVTGPGLANEGVRRARPSIPILCIPGDLTLGCTLADHDITAAEIAAGNGLCEGDSGSGAFEPKSLAAGAPTVMGVLSRAAEVGSQCAESVYERTDSASALLIAGALEAATAGAYAAPTWADPSGTTAPDAGAPSHGGEPIGDAGGNADPGAASAGGTTISTNGCAVALRSDARRGAWGVGLGALGVAGLAFHARRRRRRRID